MSISQRFFHWSIGTFLIISTFFYWKFPPNFQGDVVMYGYGLQELFFRYGVIWIWGTSLFLKPLRQVTAKDLGVFLLYVIGVSVMIAFDLRQRAQILNLFLGLVLYKMILENFDFRFLKNAAAVFFWILYANLIFCVLQVFDMDPIHQSFGGVIKGFPQPVGLMRLSEHLGTLSAILAPAIAILSPWLVLVAIPLVFFSKTSGAVACLVLSLSFLIYRSKGLKFLIPFLLLALSAGTYYVLKVDMPGGNFHYRFIVWFMGIKEVLRSSLYLGLGIGSWFQWAPQTDQLTNPQPLTWLWAHNEYLQVFFELGAVGLVILLVFLSNRFKQFEQTEKSFELDCLFASFFSLCLISVLHFPFHMGRFAPLAVFIMALFHTKMIEDSNV